MVISLSFGFCPASAKDGTSGENYQITRLASSSVTDVQCGCEGCAEYVASCVVVAAKKALADYKAAKGA